MGKRPGHCYRPVDRQPYMRKRFIHRQPASRIVSYDMGQNNGQFEVEMSLIGLERCQIRNQALEAARVAANRHLSKKLQKKAFHMRVRVKPYHYLRENKMISGAGADRVQDGMRRSFGKVIGSAARVKPNQRLITVRVDRDNITIARDALLKAAPKIPTPCKVVFDKIDPELKRKLGYGVD
ncbi:MAG: 50S ribosomal protein L16 [Candidatus Thorarchaeota archaeon]|nr:50S ribosomal protein L16 [Candidatus Thorarchaeota archaeon]